MKHCKRIVANMERKIQGMESESVSVIEEIEIGIRNSKLVLNKLREKILVQGFSSSTDERFFFKNIKPKALGYLIYYLMLSEYEINRPDNTSKNIKIHIENHLTPYQSYFREHKFFFQYMERKRTDRDNEYFLRHNGLIKFHPDALLYCMDEEFSLKLYRIIVLRISTS